MHGFIKKNQKKLLAVFGVGLMVAFLLPAGIGQMGDAHNPVAGTLGGESVRAREVSDYHLQWELLKRCGLKGSPLPYTFRLASPQEFQMMRMMLQYGMDIRRAPGVVELVETHPDAWMLLVKEAKSLGLRISSVDVQRAMEEEVVIPSSYDEVKRDLLIDGIANVLLVHQSMERVTANVKVSEPMRRHAKAESAQRIDLNLVEINAIESLSKVSAPTTQQIESQFAEFANDAPGTIDKARNPFGFGYRVPDRVTLQYVMVPRQGARDAAASLRDDYAWTVEARKDYLKNPARYMTTAPAAPTTSSAFDMSAPASTTAPTTRPFDTVRNEIVEKLVNVEAEKLQATVLSKVNARMLADYNVFKSAAPATTQSAAAGYVSFAYLQKLRDQIQQEDGVTLTVADHPSYMTSTDLSGLENIGNARGEGGTLAEYALGLAEPLAPTERKADPNVLPLHKPSQVLTDDRDNAYLFRLTGAKPSHKPTNVSDVQGKIEEDLKLKAAFELAKADAKKVLQAATVTTLQQAASLSSRPVLTSGAFSKSDALYGGAVSIPNYTVSARSNLLFVNGAYELLRDASRSGKQNPVRIVELPADGKVVVAELQSVRPANPTRSTFAVDLDANMELTLADSQVLRSAWTNWDELCKRMGWNPETNQRDPSIPATPSRPVESNPFLR